MSFNNISLNIGARVVLISIFSISIIFLYMQPFHYFSIPFVFLLIIIQSIGLVRFIHKKFDNIANHLELYLYDGPQTAQREIGWDPLYKKIHQTILKIYSNSNTFRLENERNLQYLSHIIKNTDISLISFNSEGKIGIANDSFLKLIHTTRIKNLEELSDTENIYQFLKNSKAGEHKTIHYKSSEYHYQLQAQCSVFKTDNVKWKLVSFNNIKASLEEKEFSTWSNLIAVLRHEIMNSVSPLNSLSSSLMEILKGKRVHDISQENLTDIEEGLSIIQSRNEGLMRFVNSYQKSFDLPEPQFESIPVKSFFNRLIHLLGHHHSLKNIDIITQVIPDNLQIFGDKKLLEQAFINLLRNAYESFDDHEDGLIALLAKRNASQQVILEVNNNGKAISPQELPKIFIPFYSSKKRGSGIGLSMVKKIISLHHAEIDVFSDSDKTSFRIIFSKT